MFFSVFENLAPKFFFPKKKFFRNFFGQKLKNPFLIDLEWSILAKGKVAISKTVPTARIRYDIPGAELGA